MSLRRLAKLRAMTPGEIAHRLAYGGYTAVERAAQRRGLLARSGRLRRALWPAIGRRSDWAEALTARRAGGRFFAWEDDPGAVRALFQTSYEPELGKARGLAEAAACHELSFFGRTFQFGSAIDWHADPVTGARWPRAYHRDVPVHGGNVGFGDVKDVWELNRHQFFVDLAKVAFLDGSAAHAASLHGLLRSWTASVPYGAGVPWACALEPAFRAFSWLWAYHLLRAAGLLDRPSHLSWLTGLYDHGRFLYRHLERYASPYNHLAGEASALFALGLLLPEVREASAWRSRGRHILESTVEAQFHPDGGSVEQSTFYHHATLGFYLLALILGRRNGVELAPAVSQAVERALEFSVALSQPDGRLPRFGGADDGKPIRLEHLPFWDFRPYYAVGAVWFERPDFKMPAGRFWEDALWLLGPEGRRAYETLPAAAPPPSAALPSSGYYVLRSDWSAQADYVCFDCGEQAGGLRRDDIPSAAHGHADCLSAVVALGGQEVLVDPGFFCYNGDPAWEVGFRRTAAHNTLAVDGRDQARHLSKMAWCRTYEAQPEGWSADRSGGWARGSHDGYARDPGGVVHRRTVWLCEGGYVAMLDEILGSGSHDIEAFFQFAPGLLERDGQGSVVYNRRFELAWACTAGVEASIVCGGADPAGGWVAHSLGVREAAPKLTLRFRSGPGRTALLTIVADRERGAQARARRVECQVRDGVPVARVAAAGGGEWLTAGSARLEGWEVETDASLAAVVLRGADPAEARGAGGSYVRVRHVGVAAAGQHVSAGEGR